MDARADLIAVCYSLSRLQLRLASAYDDTAQPRHLLTVAALKPLPRWLDTAPPNTALSGVIQAVVVAQAHLLAMLDSPAPIDPKAACLAVQHVQCHAVHWGTMTRRLAARLGYALPETPRDADHGLSIGEWNLPKPHTVSLGGARGVQRP